jgi:dipeptidyl aminopeptidase/acylaminoacyl peptidase
VPGDVKLRWAEDGQAIFAIRRHQSRGQLLRLSWPASTVAEIETGCTWLTGLAVEAGRLAFIGGRPREPEGVFTVDLATGVVTPRATDAVGVTDPETLIEPQVISWPTAGGETAWGLFYPAPAAGPQPLIVAVHGGPTSERGLTWNAQAQYFATRGWHYLEVNHRGGTGFGRAYQNRLDGQWGVVDVEDARSGAEHLIAAGLADAGRLAITGHSAGGYTTMMALTADPEFWTAGIALSGISHMYDAVHGAHRFEVKYEDAIIGPLPAAGRLWMERSPLAHADQVRRPILLFHGRRDKAVPTQQSIDFAEAVRRRGGTAELVIFEDEGHSFYREANLRAIYETMERFLDKYVLCQQT